MSWCIPVFNCCSKTITFVIRKVKISFYIFNPPPPPTQVCPKSPTFFRPINTRGDSNSHGFYNFHVYGSSCNYLFSASFSLICFLFLCIVIPEWDAMKKRMPRSENEKKWRELHELLYRKFLNLGLYSWTDILFLHRCVWTFRACLCGFAAKQRRR